jgi:transglutaminase/protease-like cytokinesis protein 3
MAHYGFPTEKLSKEDARKMHATFKSPSCSSIKNPRQVGYDLMQELYFGSNMYANTVDKLEQRAKEKVREMFTPSSLSKRGGGRLF